jgi:aflatoxin B1 aldehyde reductase
MHNAIRKLESVCEKHHIESISEAALRWIVYHSILDGDKGDAVILGGSRISMVDSNSKKLNKGSIPAEVVEVIEEIWRNVEEVAPR